MNEQQLAINQAAMDSRMLSALLSGIHRAVPFCSAPAELLLKQLGAFSSAASV